MNATVLDLLTNHSANVIYIALFAILFLGGFGLPLPEEATLITAGYLVFKGYTDFLYTIIFCLAGVISGDLAIYVMGKIWGPSFIKSRLFCRWFSHDHMSQVAHYFEKYGNKTVFLVRFFSGFRVAVFLVAGTLRMRIYRFMLMDFLGAACSVTLTVWLAYKFGARIEDLALIFKELNRLIIAAIIVAVAFSIFAYRRRRKNVKKTQAPLKPKTHAKV